MTDEKYEDILREIAADEWDRPIVDSEAAAWALAEIVRLKSDNKRLRDILLGGVESTPVREINVEDGAVEVVMQPHPWAILAIAKNFLEILGDAPNYQAITIGPVSSDGVTLIATVQRATGDSPVETVGKLQDRIAELESATRDLFYAMDQKSCGDDLCFDSVLKLIDHAKLVLDGSGGGKSCLPDGMTVDQLTRENEKLRDQNKGLLDAIAAMSRNR